MKIKCVLCYYSLQYINVTYCDLGVRFASLVIIHPCFLHSYLDLV